MSIKKNTIWNLIGTGIPIIIGVIIIPYIIKKIGVESFGILSLIWALIGYFGLFDFGLGKAITQQVSFARKNNSSLEIPSLIIPGLKLTLYLGIFGGALLGFFSKPLAYEFLNVSDTMKYSTYVSLLISAIGIPLTTLTSGLKGVIEGFEDFKSSNIFKIILGTLNLVFPALSLYFFKPNLEILVLSLIFTRVIILLMHFISVNKKVGALNYRKKYNQTTFKSLFNTGAWMTVTNIIGPLMVISDRFLLSTRIGAKMVAFYTVPFDLVIKLLIIPTALSTALFPRFSGIGGFDKIELNRIYKKSFNLTSLLMLLIIVILIFFSHLILKTWIGVEFANNSSITFSILLVGMFFNCITQIPFSLLQAIGQVKTTAIVHIIEFFLYIPLLFFMLDKYGLVGASISWTIRAILDFILMFYLNKIYLKNE
jgi:O-antigen/teichoic acid export membrane protein